MADEHVALNVGEESAKCPECHRLFKDAGLASHFSRSDCEWPLPTREQEELLLGLSLCGVRVQWTGENAQLRKTGPRATLEYYCDRLGWWCANLHSRDITANYPDTAVPDGEKVIQDTLYTRTCPWLARLHQIPLSDWKLYPEAAHTLLTFKGHRHGEGLTIRHRDGDAFAELLRKEGFDEFTVNPPPADAHENRVRFTKAGAQRFLAFTGTTPVPGKEAKWRALAALL